MNAPLYTTEILRLAASLSDPHQLADADGRAELRSPTCGSRIVTTVKLDDPGRVAALAQQAHACAFGQASAALLERAAAGQTRDDVAAALAELDAWLSGADTEPPWSLSALAPARSRKGRHGAILLPFRALLAAIEAAR
jgi:NifU-like protein involved in Fe-S cluster formation